MVDTRKKAEEAAAQELLEKNIKTVPVIQAKTKLQAAQTKMKSATNQIKAALEEFKELKDVAPSDKEAAALFIQSSWKRLMSGTTELQNATDNLADVLGSADPTVLEGDPNKQIEENEIEKERIIEEWTTFRQENFNEIKAARDMVEGSNGSEEAQPARESRVQRGFTRDQSLKPKLLDESTKLLEVKDFIIEFTNYIMSGYNPGEVSLVGHYVQMSNILQHSWTERLDRRKVMDKGLEDLCKILHEEAEKKYPKHQRRIHLLKMKKLQNETNIAFLRRLRKYLEVAEVESMTPEELAMHIFIENTDRVLGKLAIDELQKKTPSLDELEYVVEATQKRI